MRDRHYKIKCYRLDDITIERLERLREETGDSWNVLFINLLNKYYGTKSINREK